MPDKGWSKYDSSYMERNVLDNSLEAREKTLVKSRIEPTALTHLADQNIQQKHCAPLTQPTFPASTKIDDSLVNSIHGIQPLFVLYIGPGLLSRKFLSLSLVGFVCLKVCRNDLC